MSEDNYQNKTSILKQLLKDIKRKKEKHYFKFRRLRLVNMVIKAVVNGLNAISVSSIVMSFQPIHQIVLIIALTSTSISRIIRVFKKKLNFYIILKRMPFPMVSTPTKFGRRKCPLAPKKRARIQVRPRTNAARRLNFDQVAFRNYIVVRGRRVRTTMIPTRLF